MDPTGMLDRYTTAAAALGGVAATQGEALEEAAGWSRPASPPAGSCTCSAPATPSSWPSTPTPGPAGWPASTRSSTRTCPRPWAWSWPGSSGQGAGPRPSWRRGPAHGRGRGGDLQLGRPRRPGRGRSRLPRARPAGGGLTNLEQAKATAPRHSSGARLHELADVVIDNRCPSGDAAVLLASGDQVGPLTTVVGAAIVAVLRPGGRAAAGPGTAAARPWPARTLTAARPPR